MLRQRRCNPKYSLRLGISAKGKARIKRRKPLIVKDIDFFLRYCKPIRNYGSTLIIETDSKLAVEGLRRCWLSVLSLAKERNCKIVFIYLGGEMRPYYKIYHWFLHFR
jgi:hypothetical protein